ncbi:hypothetical protein HJFPF1_04936 [Paramyrothecium foliicola]|nr:hypothetical protein HJFPF1_04936 [Paramyrothecium foliicola]
MAHHHHYGATYSQPVFVAELEAPSAGPPLASIVNGAPIFEMSGESAAVEGQSERKQPLQPRAATPEIPAQANPWPFYLEDATHGNLPRTDVKEDKLSAGQAQEMEPVPAQANPWPYHGPPGDDSHDDIKASAARDETAPQPGSEEQSRPHDAGQTAGNKIERRPLPAAQHPSTTSGKLRTGISVPEHGDAESVQTVSPTQLYPAPLKVSRSSRPSSQSGAHSPAPIESTAPTPVANAAPSPSSVQLTLGPATLPYRPYRPPSPLPPGQTSAAATPTAHDSAHGGSLTPYPADSPPRYASMPQGPDVPQSPPSSLKLAARRGTQPSPVALGPPAPYPDAHPQRQHSLPTPTFAPSPQTPVAHQALASPSPSPIGSSHRPSASPVASQQISYGPSQPNYLPPPSPGAGPGFSPMPYAGPAGVAHGGFHPPLVSSPPPMAQPPHSPGVGGPYPSANALPQAGEQSQLGRLQPLPQPDYGQYQPRPTSSSSQHQQAQGMYPVPPQAQQLNVEPHPTPQYYSQYQQQQQQQQQQPVLAPPPPPPFPSAVQPPRPQIHHVSTDPLSPTYLHPQSPPPPYIYDVHRTNSQPVPAAHVPPIYPPPQSPLSPTAYSPIPQSPYYAHSPHDSPQSQYPQQQYLPNGQLPPLPPRPVSAHPMTVTTGFGPGIPSTASFPPPPKTQYVPPPQIPPRPSMSTMKLFSGSSAKKWLDKTNQVLESKLVPMLQAQTDTRTSGLGFNEDDFLQLFSKVIDYFKESTAESIQTKLDRLTETHAGTSIQNATAESQIEKERVQKKIYHILEAWTLMEEYTIFTRPRIPHFGTQAEPSSSTGQPQLSADSAKPSLSSDASTESMQAKLKDFICSLSYLPSEDEVLPHHRPTASILSPRLNVTNHISFATSPLDLYHSDRLTQSLSISACELNLKRLERLVNVEVLWTDNIARHLLVTQCGAKHYLELFALPCAVQPGPREVLDTVCGIQENLINEIESSYALLLNPISLSKWIKHTNRTLCISGFCWCRSCRYLRYRTRLFRRLKIKPHQAQKRYTELLANRSSRQSEGLVPRPPLPFDPRIEELAARQQLEGEDTMLYFRRSSYPLLWSRIVALDGLLQQAEPWNLRTLFRNKNDTLKYWTFV